MLFVPISIIGMILHLLYLLDIFVPDTVVMMVYVITPVCMAVTGVWLIWKHRITTFSVKVGIVALSAIAAIYGFDVMYISGGFYMLPLLLGISESSGKAWFIIGTSWFILVITYVALLVGQWIVKLVKKKNSAE